MALVPPVGGAHWRVEMVALLNSTEAPAAGKVQVFRPMAAAGMAATGGTFRSAQCSMA